MKKIVILAICTFLFNLLAGQEKTSNEERRLNSIENRKTLDKKNLLKAKNMTPFIFEGEVIAHKDHYADDKWVYTQKTIRISKIFKGDYNNETLELIYGEEQIPNSDGSLMQLRTNLPIGEKGIFYCVKNTMEIGHLKNNANYFSSFKIQCKGQSQLTFRTVTV